MSVYLDALQAELRRKLRAKQRALEVAAFDCNAAAVRRKEKSIALLTAKLLCPHAKLSASPISRNGKPYTYVYCLHCKSSTFLE